MRNSGLAFHKDSVTRVLIRSLSVLVLLGPTTSRADLEGRTGAYLYDIPIPMEPGGKSIFSLKYSSRSQFRGRFGYGWCSPLDKSVQFSIDDSVHINSCGETQELTGHPKWNHLNLTYQDADGLIYKFNKSGQLIALNFDLNNSREALTVEYVGKDLIYLKNSRQRWAFSSSKSYGFIDRIHTDKELILSLTYKEDLLNKTQGKLEIEFSYDEWKNIIQVSQVKKTPIRITYDLGFDRVKSIEKDSCNTNLTYSSNSAIRQLSVQQFCSSIPVYSKTYSL